MANLQPIRYWLFFFIVTLFFSPSPLQAQVSPIDSLRRLLNNQSGVQKVDALNALAVRLILLDFNLAKQEIEKAIKLAEEIDYKNGLAEATVNKAICENVEGRSKQSLIYLREALANAKTISVEGYAFIQIANVYRGKGAYDSARYWYGKAQGILENSPYKLHLSILYKNLGQYYQLLRDPELEIDYFLRSMELRQQLSDDLFLLDISLFLAKSYFREFDFKQSEKYLKIAQQYTQYYPNTEPEKETTYLQALVQFRLAKYEEALLGFEQVLQYYSKHGNQNEYGNILVDIAELLEEMGSYDLSLKNGFEALRLSETHGLVVQRTRALLIISRNYQRLNQIALAHEYNSKAISNAKEHNLKRLEGAAYNQTGLILQIEGKVKEALIEYEKGYAIRKEVGDKLGMAASLGNIGEMYEELGFLEKALTIQDQSEAVAKSVSNQLSLFWAYYNKAKIYLRLKNLSKASYYISLATKIERKTGYRLAQLYIYPLRRDLLKAQGNYKEALDLETEYIKLKDSLNSSSLTNRVLSLQSMYKLERKDLEIALLNKNKDIQEEKIRGQEAQLRNREYMLGLGSLALVLAIGLAYSSWRSSKRMTALNREIQEQKEEIQAQSEEMSEVNRELASLNQALSEKQDEIETQNEELIQSNEEITSQRDLVHAQYKELERIKSIVESQNLEISRRNLNLEAEVDSRTKELVEYNQQLEQFAFISSHNLRAPVARILGLGQLLELPHVNATDEVMIRQKLFETTRELDRVVKDLNMILEVRRNNSGVLTEINLAEEVNLITINLEKEIIETRTRIEVDFSEIPDIRTLRPYLDSILMNLVSNAIKYRSPNRLPIIHIKSELKGEYICLRIKDNGLGINIPLYKDKLFTLYQRFHDHVEGKGLGLYLVKTQVNSLGGKIEVESEVDQGSTFYIYLKASV